MRFSVGLGGLLVLGTAVAKDQDNLCKRASGDSASFCGNSGICEIKGWLGRSNEMIPVTACANRVLPRAKFAYDGHVNDIQSFVGIDSSLVVNPATMFRASHVIPRSGGCPEFLKLFTGEFSAYLHPQAHPAIVCLLEDLSGYMPGDKNSEDRNTALRALWNIYKMFPFIPHPPLNGMSEGFVTKLVKAKNNFPGPYITPDVFGTEPPHSQLLLAADGVSATAWLIKKMQEPVRMTFENLMDLIMQAHAFLQMPVPVTYEPRDFLGMGDFDEIPQYSEEWRGVRREMSSLPDIVLRMVDALEEERTELKGRVPETVGPSTSSMVEVVPEDRERLAELNKWFAEDYPNILIYFIYLRSADIMSMSARERTKWNTP